MTDFPPPGPSGMPYPGMVTPPGVIAPGSAPVSKQNNWQGVVALVSALTVVGGVLAVIFGALGLQSVRARTATNRNAALAGLVLGGVLTLAGFVAMVGVAVFAWGTPSGSHFTAPEDLVVGDCFAKYGDAGQEGEGFSVSGLYVMDCASPHYGEVYYIGKIAGLAYPGVEEAAVLTEEGCFSDAAAQGVDLDKVAKLGFFSMYPTTDSWEMGDRSYDCMLVSEAEDLVGSVLLTP